MNKIFAVLLTLGLVSSLEGNFVNPIAFSHPESCDVLFKPKCQRGKRGHRGNRGQSGPGGSTGAPGIPETTPPEGLEIEEAPVPENPA